jgi:hypothetical protein
MDLNLLTLRKSEFYQSLLHNLIFGLAGVWMPFIALAFVGKWRVREVFLDGSLLMFAVTLSAVSLGFFVKETQINLRSREMLTYVGLMMTMTVGILGLTALTFSTSFQAITLNMLVVCSVSTIIALLAVILNFRLFMITIENELPLDRLVVESKLNADAVEIREQAKSENKVGDINL